MILCLLYLLSYSPVFGLELPLFPRESHEDSLVLLHVLFRHGHRTPNGPEELYANDPYLNETYFPVGLGQLTNPGKVREYLIGKTLQNRYGRFLGPYYYPEIVDPVSTDYNRTKMSLQLVLASLFPPKAKQIWNSGLGLIWQPVPYNYLPRPQDKVLLGTICPNYLNLYKQNLQSSKEQAKRRQYQETFDYLTKNTGQNMTTFQDVYNLYFGLSAEEEWGFKLPEWTRKVWPKNITELAIKEYYVATATTDLRRMAAGYLLQKIIADTRAKISGKNRGRKIYLYSAHESNVAETLITQGIFDPPHIPTYGSYIIWEIHRVNNSYAIKILYENYTTRIPQVLKLPACETLCEINKFASLLEEYMPSDNLCGNNNC